MLVCVLQVLIPVVFCDLTSAWSIVAAALSGRGSRRVDKCLLLVFSGLKIEHKGECIIMVRTKIRTIFLHLQVEN